MKDRQFFESLALLGLIAVAVSVVGLEGCGRSESPDAAAWTAVEADATPRVASASAQADEAIGAMAGLLMASLKQALADGGPGQAIEVCQELAPRLAKQISEEHGLQIGRTSFRTRSTANAPPTWAQAAVERQESSPLVFTSQEGAVGFLRPIRLMAACVQCHGTPQQIAPAVQAVLDQRYPQDQATGFAVGEVRGYFWVEVPASVAAQP